METLDINCLARLTKTSCRLCLATEINNSKPFSQAQHLVRSLTNLVISDLDFSATICQTCISTLNNFGEFKRKCHEVTEFLYSHGYCQLRPLSMDSHHGQDVVELQEQAKCEEIYSEFSSVSDAEAPEPFPKLKKRDLMETKAYRGLCHLCGREFQHLWVHLQSHNAQPTETCDVCGKGFKSKANLQLHTLLHKDAQLPCDICGKRYRTKMRLKRHQRVHNGHRPFECGVCSKRFYTKYNLDVHGRSHTGSRPYSCEVCEESFIHSYALKNHTDKYHKL